MPHIHTKPGEIDRTVAVYIVHVPSKRVLLRLHDKHHIYLPPGGHIENHQTAPEAAIAEAKEEVGLDITLWQGNQLFRLETDRYRELPPPIALNVHVITPEHRHEDHVYLATTESMEIVEPDSHEKSGGCLWLARAEVLAHPDLKEDVRAYALKALDILAPEAAGVK